MNQPREDLHRLASYVVDARIKAGFATRKDFAAATGVTARTLGKLETASERVSNDTLARVARELRWTPDSPALVMAGREPKAAARAAGTPLRAAPAEPFTATAPAVEEAAQEILDSILSRYPGDDAVQAIGVRPGWRPAKRVVEILRILGDRELSQEVLDSLTARYPDDGVVEAIGARQSRRNPAVRVLDVFAWLTWQESDPELAQGDSGMTGLASDILSES